MIFPHQSATFVFKIEKQGASGSSELEERTSFGLRLYYRTFAEEMLQRLRVIVDQALKEAGLHKYWYKVQQFLNEVHFTREEFEQYGLFHHIPRLQSRQTEWNAFVEFTPSSDCKNLQSLLEGLPQPLHQEGDLHGELKSIFIPVEVPRLQMMHTIDIDFGDLEYGIVGKAIEGTVHVSASTVWCGDDLTAANDADFLCEVQKESADWIVGGTRILPFKGKDSTLVFSISIIPVREGHLLLPNIDVRPLQADLSCEVDYKKVALSLLVLSDSQPLRFEFPETQSPQNDD